MLAERQRAAGDLSLAFRTCRDIRFGRECTFHLIRSEAWSVLAEPADRAAERLVELQDLPFARDGERLFWREWHHRSLVEGRSVDAARCDVLADPTPCRVVVGDLFRDAAAALGWPKICDRVAAGKPPLTLTGGEPAYLASPEVDGWVARSCLGR
jgi:hypothetical protein